VAPQSKKDMKFKNFTSNLSSTAQPEDAARSPGRSSLARGFYSHILSQEVSSYLIFLHNIKNRV